MQQIHFVQKKNFIKVTKVALIKLLVQKFHLTKFIRSTNKHSMCTIYIYQSIFKFIYF